MAGGLWSQFDSSEAVTLYELVGQKTNLNKNGNIKDNGEKKISDFFYFFFQIYSREYRTLKPEQIDKEKFEPNNNFFKNI